MKSILEIGKKAGNESGPVGGRKLIAITQFFDLSLGCCNLQLKIE
jgi:hypothetical protein